MSETRTPPGGGSGVSAEKPAPLYGVWTGSGWWLKVDGSLFCSPHKREMAALLVNQRAQWPGRNEFAEQVREIGEDGKPVEE